MLHNLLGVEKKSKDLSKQLKPFNSGEHKVLYCGFSLKPRSEISLSHLHTD